SAGGTPMMQAGRTLLLGAGLLWGCTSSPAPPDTADLALPGRAPDGAARPPDGAAQDLAQRTWPQVVVMQSRLRGFAPANEKTASVAFARGPGSAPLGLGSFHLQTGAGT